MAGSFSTLCEGKVKIKLQELNFMAHIFAPFHITSQKSNYDVIFGQDLLQESGINLDFQNPRYPWNQLIEKWEPILQFKKVKILRVQLIDLKICLMAHKEIIPVLSIKLNYWKALNCTMLN